jgi:hypothetical protein
MKLKGQRLCEPAIEVVVFPRQSGDLVFTVKAVINDDDFEKLCPRPVPPTRLLPGNIHQINVEDPKYKEAMHAHATQRINWLYIQSLSATEGLEWETVDPANPNTWVNYTKELIESGMTIYEIKRLLEAVMSVNGLNSARIEEATKAFLAGRAAQSSKQ